MEPASPSAPARLPFFSRLFRWFLSPRTLRRFLFVFLCLATLVAAFYAIENWRGRRAFSRIKLEAEARGLKLDWKDVVPPPIPDEQNAAAHPFLKPMLDYT